MLDADSIPSGSNWEGLTSVVVIGGLSLVFLILSLDILVGVRSLLRIWKV
jgi:hypothetical protein